MLLTRVYLYNKILYACLSIRWVFLSANRVVAANYDDIHTKWPFFHSNEQVLKCLESVALGPTIGQISTWKLNLANRCASWLWTTVLYGQGGLNS